MNHDSSPSKTVDNPITSHMSPKYCSRTLPNHLVQLIYFLPETLARDVFNSHGTIPASNHKFDAQIRTLWEIDQDIDGRCDGTDQQQKGVKERVGPSM